MMLQKRAGHKKRHRRQAEPKKYLEVLIAADPTVIKFIGKDQLESYILTIMNIVSVLLSGEYFEF